MTEARRRIRLSHLTVAKSLARMRRNEFSVADISATSGLHPRTVRQFIRALVAEGVIVACDARDYDAAGRRTVRCWRMR